MRQELLESFIRQMLLEFGDEFGDFEGGGWSDLVKILGGPDTVFKTMMGSIANISNKGRTLLATVAKGIPSLVIPFIETRYEKIQQAEERRQGEIMRMYPEIFSIARNGFPNDGELFAFMLNPVVMTAVNLGKFGTDVALDLVDALSGQSPDVITRTRPLRRRVAARQESVDRRIVEAGKNELDDVRRLLSDRSFQSLVSRSEPVVKIRQYAKSLKNSSLNDIITLAKRISEVESIEDLKDAGLDIDISRYKDELEAAGDLQAVKAVVQSAKSYAFSALIKRLQQQIEELRSLDIPDNSELFTVYENTIKRIQSLQR